AHSANCASDYRFASTALEKSIETSSHCVRGVHSGAESPTSAARCVLRRIGIGHRSGLLRKLVSKQLARERSPECTFPNSQLGASLFRHPRYARLVFISLHSAGELDISHNYRTQAG